MRPAKQGGRKRHWHRKFVNMRQPKIPMESSRSKKGSSMKVIVNNVTSNVPQTTARLQENFVKNHSSELTIGTILAILLFMAIICYYVWQLQSPRYRRRFGRSARNHRRSTARRSERLRSQGSIAVDNFQHSYGLPRYESVVFLNSDEPHPYDFPPSYDEAVKGQLAGNDPQILSGNLNQS